MTMYYDPSDIRYLGQRSKALGNTEAAQQPSPEIETTGAPDDHDRIWNLVVLAARDNS